jgi:hypothetical protein
MVFIQQIETGKFYGKDGLWVAERAAAQEFLTVAVAEQLCRTVRLRGVEVMEQEGAVRGKFTRWNNRVRETPHSLKVEMWPAGAMFRWRLCAI